MASRFTGLASACALAGFACGLTAAPAHAETPIGDWGGLLLGQLHVVFHIEQDRDGHYKATSESPDQGDAIIPVETVDVGPDHLNLSMPGIAATYAGRWDDTQQAWVGSLTQGRAVPLTLHRLSASELAAMVPKRPQDEAAAKALQAFHPEEVRIPNPEAPGVSLAGVFSKPAGSGRFPAVVLIAGSGAQTRDEEVARHKIFLVLAAELNRRGVAVLRYDKRGVRASTGDGATATTADYASDAAAVFRYLLARADVDARNSGLIGHSEGGAVAPLVAQQEKRVAFTVLMAGPGQRGAEMLLAQQRLIAQAQGAPAERVRDSNERNRRLFDEVLAARNEADALERLRSSAVQPPVGPADLSLASPWTFHFLRYDPKPALERLRIPTLALIGARDLQVPPADNLPILREALRGNPQATVRELPALNHLFQHARTGSPAEYPAIEETLSPDALTVIGDWVSAQAGLRTAAPAGDKE